MKAIAFFSLLLFCNWVGVNADAPKISITTNVSSVKVGSTVTFSYSIKGSGTYSNIHAQWEYETEDRVWQDSDPSKTLTTLSGTYTVKAKYGKTLSTQIWVSDEKGQMYSSDSVQVKIIGAPVLKPTIRIVPDKDTVQVGEPVSFSYQITGPGQYSNLHAQWDYRIGPNWWQDGGPSQ